MPSYAASDDFLDFSEVEFETRNGLRTALIAAPKRRIRLGRDRLAQLRAGDAKSPVNERLLAALDHAGHPIHVIVFKAGGIGEGSWGFDEDLGSEECAELGYHLVKSQLRLYQDATRRGAFTVVGVEFGRRELDGYELGTDRLAAELEREIAEGSESSVGRLNLWLIDHVGLWSSLSLDEFLRDRAAEATATAERHRRQMDRMLREVDAHG